MKGDATDCNVIAMIVSLEKIRVANIATVAKTLFNLCKKVNFELISAKKKKEKGQKEVKGAKDSIAKE